MAKREIKFREWEGFEMNYEPLISMISTASVNQRFLDGDIMQYIGLKDKNGVDVYEGDIVEGTLYFAKDDFFEIPEKLLQEVGEVLFNMDEGAWHLCVKDGGDYDGGFLFRYDSIEVIGNIHQNPELLLK